MSQEHASELRVFKQLADTIGETLEQVYEMQELERRQLIMALGIEKGIVKVQWDQCTQDNSEGSDNSSKNKFYDF